MSIQLPDGASVQRTSDAMKQVEDMLLTMPQVQDTFSIIGYSRIDGVSEPNAGFIVAKLKPFAQRPTEADSAQALIAKITREAAAIRTASVIAFNLPPIIGLSTTGGFEYQLEALEGQDPSAIASVMQALVAAANATRRCIRSSRPSPPPIHRSSSTSTARRRRRSASTSPTSSRRCRRRSGEPT